MALINKPKRKRKEPNYNRKLTDRRKARRGVYNSKLWRDIRQSKLMLSPICENCLRNGKVTLAEHIHHKRTFLLKDGTVDYALAYDINNLESLCPQCHIEEHVEQKRIRESKVTENKLLLEIKDEQDRMDKIKRLEDDECNDTNNNRDI